MPAWPATLPVSPDADGYGEQGKFPVVQAPNDGPPLSRRRYTAAPMPIKARYLFDEAQLVAFETFWNVDLKMGALSFTGPTRGNAAVTSTYKAVGAFQLSRASDPYWFVTLDLIRTP